MLWLQGREGASRLVLLVVRLLLLLRLLLRLLPLLLLVRCLRQTQSCERPRLRRRLRRGWASVTARLWRK